MTPETITEERGGVARLGATGAARLSAAGAISKPHHEAVIRAADPADRFTRRVFRSVCCEGPPIRRDRLRGSPTMIVSSHRSHMDYILLGIHCSRLGYRDLRFAAGDNLIRVPYLGSKFVSLGAFPIYRDRVTSRTYLLGLCEEVAGMLDDGDNVIVFPEGGRSYSGAMLKMKAGVIAANLIAQFRSPDRPHCYLPFTVSYEVLPEIGHLGLLGRSRRLRRDKHARLTRAAGSVLYYGADLAAFTGFVLSAASRGRYGNVYLDYGEPFEIGSVVDVERACVPDAKSALIALKAAARRVAEEIARRLARLYRILPMHVLAHELTNGHTRQGDITARIPAAVESLHAQGRNCRALDELSSGDVFDQGAAQLGQLKAVAVRAGDVRVMRPEVVSYCARAVELLDQEP
jgi:1-acyl-sn-glycerol-3-phosphate acyltransferase